MAAELEWKASAPEMERFPAIARVRFECEAIESLRLPPYPGSAWRGLLGHSLRRTVCVTRQPTCEGCLLIGTCSYSVFFESPPTSPEIANRYTALPHPFVLDVDVPAHRDIKEGDALRLGVTLFGPAIDLLPYLIQSMDRAGQRGLGAHGGRFVLREVRAETETGSGHWRSVFHAESGEYRRIVGSPPNVEQQAPAGAIQIDLQTPLRIKRQGHFLGTADLLPADLVRSLLIRLASMAALYGTSKVPCDWTESAPDPKDLRLTNKDVSWTDWTRYSSRQRTTMQMGGLVGILTLDGPGIPALWPALWLGQWTHLGKGTSFGLGKYRVSDAGASEPLPTQGRKLAGSEPSAGSGHPVPRPQG